MTTPVWPGFDAQLSGWLDETPGAPEGSSAQVLRELSRVHNALAFSRLRPSLRAASVRDETLDGPGGPLTVRIFTPGRSDAKSGEPIPLIAHFHGGGWVIGDLDTHLAHTHRLCAEAGAVVVSVDYRRGPEHRFPAAFDDCVAATEWVAGNADRLGADAELLVVAGDSAGGQLAASVALARRDAGRSTAGQLLIYPVTAVAGRYEDPAVNADYPARTDYALGPSIGLVGMAAFTAHYVDALDSADWRVSPLDADLAGVAPAVIHTATFDLLRDDGARYAQALRDAGVAVIEREFATLSHAYFGLGGVSAAADAAATQAAVDLRELLGLRALPAI